MNDYSISMYIDNELDLDEKINFVEVVHSDERFKDQAVELLEQEKLLLGDVALSTPDIKIPSKPQRKQNFIKLWLPSFAGFAAACVLLVGFYLTTSIPVSNSEELHRFVIYQPDAVQAEIIGTFTGWAPVALEKIGGSGYWSISINLPEGEHHYSYLLENGQQIADPTVLIREQDGFGGENSIIRVSAAI